MVDGECLRQHATPRHTEHVRLRECRDWNCFALGVRVRPAYRHAATHEINPTAMHSMSRDLHIALEQANLGESHGEVPVPGYDGTLVVYQVKEQ